MKRFFLSWVLLAISLTGIGADAGKAQPPAAPALEGSWTGTIISGRFQSQLLVTIDRTANGRIQGSVTGVPGNDLVPIDAVERSGNKVKLILGPIGGFFDAVLSDDGTRLTGTWSEIAITQPLELVRLPASPSPTAAPSTPG